MFCPFRRGRPQSGQFTSVGRDGSFSAVFFDFRLKKAKYESAKIMSRIATNKKTISIKTL